MTERDTVREQEDTKTEELGGLDRVGEKIYGEVCEVIELDTSDEPLRFVGVELGFGTSHKNTHLNHPAGSAPAKGKPCSGCRWTEAFIFYNVTHDQYMVQTIGRSDVEGESDIFKTLYAQIPTDVVKSLLVPPPRWSDRPRSALEMPPANYRALQEASERDAALGTIFDDWNQATGGRHGALRHPRA